MSEKINRRKALAAGGSIAALALAGCAEETDGESTPTPAKNAPQPPEPPAGPVDNEIWQYMIDSMHYQNQRLYEMTNGG